MSFHIRNGLIIESVDANDFEFAGSGYMKILSDEEIWKYYTPQVPITEEYLSISISFSTPSGDNI